MVTAFKNNAETHTGRHLRRIINVLFDVKGWKRTARSTTASQTEKQEARAWLADVSSFKDIIPTAGSFDEILVHRMDELQGLGYEFLHPFYFLSPVLEQIGGGQYREQSIWYELAANNSAHVLYLLAKVNSLLPDYNNLRPISVQPFPLRLSFIPSDQPFDLSVDGFQILRLTRKGVSEAHQDPDAFWAARLY
jgi:hypothetical protein